MIFEYWGLKNTTFQGKKARVDLKTQTKGYDNGRIIKDNSTGIISVQRKALYGNTEKLNKKLKYALKEDNDA